MGSSVPPPVEVEVDVVLAHGIADYRFGGVVEGHG